jgi:Xaa-Pro aminopeptidase
VDAQLPFSQQKLDALMDEAGVDLLLVTSKENVQYLLAGYRSSFYILRDAFGTSRYLPCLGYPKGELEKSFYVGNPLEQWQQEVEPGFWVKDVDDGSWHSAITGCKAAERIRRLGLDTATVGVEKSFLPADTFAALAQELPNARFVDAHYLLDRLRAVKRPDELNLLRQASEQIVDSMLEVVRSSRPGMTTGEIADEMMREEVSRGLSFEYCLTCAGPSFNRAPSGRRWEDGWILSLDSGGNKHGYIGDLARMAVMGKPTSLMTDLLEEIKAVQAAARSAVRPGVAGAEIFAKALAARAQCPHKDEMVFNAHGMGLVQHEAPYLSTKGPIPYPGLNPKEVERPIEAGMVLSIETDLLSPEIGFTKLEDTIAVTEGGFEAYGDGARDWIVVD